MLNVLMVATSYPADHADWRGRFIFDMAESLASCQRLNMSLWAPPGALPAGVYSALAGDDAIWLDEMQKQGGIAHLLRKRPIPGGIRAVGLLQRLRRGYRNFAGVDAPKVVHVNWLQNALPLLGTPTSALITVLGSDLGLLRIPGMVGLLRLMLAGRRAVLAPNAEWMVPILTQYFGDLTKICPVPFGVHSRWFAIRREPDSFSSADWLMVSRVTKAKLGHLLDWGGGLFGERRRLHLLGPMQEDVKLPAWVKYHGPTNPEALACEWFPRVAGLLTLSTHDEGRPQVMIEAMAAGLPVVATDMPAHRDLLRNGETGQLVGGVEDLKSALIALDDPVRNRFMGEAARAWAEEVIGTWDDCARRYVDAYDYLLERV